MTTISKDRRDRIKQLLMPDASDLDLELFAGICEKYDLDPFLTEIAPVPYNVKDRKTNRTYIKYSFQITRDGLLKIANRDPNFLGLQSAAVYTSDTFMIDFNTNKINHVINAVRGDLQGAWARALKWNPSAKRENQPYIAYADMAHHADMKNSFWLEFPEKMIIRDAEKNALQKVTGKVEPEENRLEETPMLEPPLDTTPLERAESMEELENEESNRPQLPAETGSTIEPQKIEPEPERAEKVEPVKSKSAPISISLKDMVLSSKKETTPKKETTVSAPSKASPTLPVVMLKPTSKKESEPAKITTPAKPAETAKSPDIQKDTTPSSGKAEGKKKTTSKKEALEKESKKEQKKESEPTKPPEVSEPSKKESVPAKPPESPPPEKESPKSIEPKTDEEWKVLKGDNWYGSATDYKDVVKDVPLQCLQYNFIELLKRNNIKSVDVDKEVKQFLEGEAKKGLHGEFPTLVHLQIDLIQTVIEVKQLEKITIEAVVDAFDMHIKKIIVKAIQIAIKLMDKKLDRPTFLKTVKEETQYSDNQMEWVMSFLESRNLVKF